jgi:hypothetical protein
MITARWSHYAQEQLSFQVEKNWFMSTSGNNVFNDGNTSLFPNELSEHWGVLDYKTTTYGLIQVHAIQLPSHLTNSKSKLMTALVLTRLVLIGNWSKKCTSLTAHVVSCVRKEVVKLCWTKGREKTSREQRFVKSVFSAVESFELLEKLLVEQSRSRGARRIQIQSTIIHYLRWV